MRKYVALSVISVAGQLAFGQAKAATTGAVSAGSGSPGTGSAGAGTVRAGSAVRTGSSPAAPTTPPQIRLAPGSSAINNAAPATPNGILAPTVNGANPISGTPVGVTFNSLPAAARNTIISQANGTGIGPVTEQMSASGPVYTTSVIQNGQPTQIQVSAAGTIIPNSPAVTAAAGTQAGVGLSPIQGVTTTSGFGAQAGLALGTLPAGVQASILTQTGNGTVQSITQTETPNGPLYTVTANQNGVPTQMQFAANGSLLSSTAVPGTTIQPVANTLGSTLANGTLGTAALNPAGLPADNGLVVWEDLPASVQNGIRGQVGNSSIDRITPRSTANGMAYNVQFQRNGVPQSVLVGPDGKMLSSSAGTATASNSTRLSVSDLPDEVERSLKKAAPDADIQFVNRQTRAEGDVYTVGLHADNRYTELVIDANGRIIRDSRAIPVIVKSSPVKNDEQANWLTYSTLPAAIKNAVKAYTPEIEVGNVQTATRDGKNVYEIEFFDNGHTDRLVMGRDGNFVSRDHDVVPTYASSTSSPIVEPSEPASIITPPIGTDSVGNAPAREIGKAKEPANTIALKQLPLAAQNTVKELSGSGLIETITPRVENSAVVYEVRFLDNGKERTVIVDKDGSTQQK